MPSPEGVQPSDEHEPLPAEGLSTGPCVIELSFWLAVVQPLTTIASEHRPTEIQSRVPGTIIPSMGRLSHFSVKHHQSSEKGAVCHCHYRTGMIFVMAQTNAATVRTRIVGRLFVLFWL